MTRELDRYGFPLGSGIFETIRVEESRPIALNRHMRRALNSAEELGIALPSEETLRVEIERAISEKNLPLGRLRLCFSNEFYDISYDAYEDHVEPMRINFLSKTSEGLAHKVFPYVQRFDILKVANAEGFDDSILFNGANEVTETAVSNLVFRIADLWVTPPISSGILPGTMRALAIEECGVQVRPIHITEIAEVQSAFSLASLRIIRAISHIGDMKIEIGEASRDFEAQFRSVVQSLSVG